MSIESSSFLEEGSMFLKVVRIFIASVILFSYLPVIPVDDCPAQDHMDDVRMNCGYIFHCPFISSIGPLESVTILNIGWLVSIAPSLLIEDIEYPVFHPPEAISNPHSFSS